MIVEKIDGVSVQYQLQFVNWIAVNQCEDKMKEFYLGVGHLTNFCRIQYSDLKNFVSDFVKYRNTKRYDVSDKIRQYLADYDVDVRIQKDKSILVTSNKIFGFDGHEYPDYSTFTVRDHKWQRENGEWNGHYYDLGDGKGFGISCCYLPDQQYYVDMGLTA